MPFDVAASDGVLTLTLDTPGSPINVFNRATAAQLVDILADVTPATTRAIVFQSAKPGSFINGVGLLLAHASRTADDVARASAPAWHAYRAVRAAPVPTIAVVQGSCYGCGVEFVLHCDYRITSDSWDTEFYMTELNDYLFIPVFGSTWNLPDTVGLDAAIELLLWGTRWRADTALAHGLVDDALPHDRVADASRAFVDRVLTGRQPRRRRGRVAADDAAVSRARERIAALPPQYRDVYGEALRLLEAGARRSGTYDAHRAKELAASAASALSPNGKAAYGFFYLRQMASERAAGRARAEPPVTVGFEVDGDVGARAFAADLCRRRVLGVTVDATSGPEYVLRSAGRPVSNGGRPVTVHAGVVHGRAGGAELYAPMHAVGGRLIELAISDTADGMPPEAAGRLTRVLQRLGFEVARTTPVDTFVSNRLLAAYLGPLVRLVQRGEDGARINGVLRDFGFVRRPHDLLRALDRRAVAREVAAETDGVLPALAVLATPDSAAGGDVRLVDALCISLLAVVLEARVNREVRDPSILDLIARELLDFPRHLSSLCSWLKTARVAEALAAGSAVGELAGETAYATAQRFVDAGRELYR